MMGPFRGWGNEPMASDDDGDDEIPPHWDEAPLPPPTFPPGPPPLRFTPWATYPGRYRVPNPLANMSDTDVDFVLDHPEMWDLFLGMIPLQRRGAS